MRSLNGNNGQAQNKVQSRLLWLKLTTLLLVAIILVSMVKAISEVVQGFQPELAWSMLGIGLVIAWGLARFGHRGWSAALFSFFSGLLMSAMIVGRLWDEWHTLWNNLIWWAGTAIQAAVRTLEGQLTLPSFGIIPVYILDFTEGVFVMLQRFVLWVWRFPRMNSDLISIQMVWSILIWLASIWAVWFLWRRNRPMEAVIPAFLLVAVARSYSDASPNIMLLMLGAAIALMIISSQVNRERDWAARGIGYSELIRKNSTQAAMTLSVILVFVSGGITSIDIDEVRARWEAFTARRSQSSSVSNSGISRSLGIEPNASRVTLAEQFGKLSQGGLPSDHLVGSGPELTDEVVMVVRVEETDPRSGNSILVDAAAQTYYFRSLAYDQYTSQGWYSSSGKIFAYQGGQEAVNTYTNRQRLIKQQVRYEQEVISVNKVHSVGELAVVDRLYNAFWREGSSPADFTDLFGATIDSRSYEAYSIVPVFSEDDLRDARTDYPEWITDRYFDLPSTVPDRVIDLSFELTAQELTVYDKAVAIEQYLRTFPYTLDLPIRAATEDIADHFLFEVQRGYCDYYASSMVVLARAAGIPARLAVGYIGGTYDEENDYYVVTADKAHSWVEVYFPEYGWVTFEPTAGRAAIFRETESFDLPEFEQKIVFSEEKFQLSGLEILVWSILGVLAFALLVFIIWLQVDVFILRRQSIDKAFAKLYKRLQWMGRILGIQQGIAQTPIEFSAEMRSRMDDLRSQHPSLGFLEKTSRTVENLVMLANKAAYSVESADAFERARAVDFWVLVRRHLGVAILWNWVVRLIPKPSNKAVPEVP